MRESARCGIWAAILRATSDGPRCAGYALPPGFAATAYATGPFPLPRPIISLQLQKPDGTRVPLKCGKVRKGDGLIVVTVQAYDPNMSQIAVTARGNSGLSVPVVDITATPLSKISLSTRPRRFDT